MSEESVEVVREAIQAWNAGDMERLRELYDPDVVVRAPPGWPEPGPFVGRDAAIAEQLLMRDAFERDSLDVVGDILHQGDRVIAQVHWRGVGQGPQSDMRVTAAFTIRKHLVFGVDFFWDHGEALETAGLSK